MAEIGVLGAGTWGMALARMLANNGHAVEVWSALPQELDNLAATHRHPNLGDMVVPESITYTSDLAGLCAGKEFLLFAVPSIFVRGTAARALPFLEQGQVLIDVAKGVEEGTLYTMSEILQDVLKGRPELSIPVVALSGPTHAEEVARDLPTAIVAASGDPAAAERVQNSFMNPRFRVYTNTDVRGVELGGAIKNIIALAVGIAQGLGYGDNSKAALITRGAAEITRLGTAMGCNPATFAGLAGIGDLIVTCTSLNSRNLRCGILLGKGVPKEEAVKQVGMVVEGINALPGALELADKYAVEMPIVHTADAILAGRLSPRDAVNALMLRDKKAE